MTTSKGLRTKRVTPRPITEDEVKTYIALREQGMLFREIAIKLNRSKSTVVHAYNRFKESGHYKPKKLHKDAWPLTRDPMAVKVQFEDVDAATLAREAKRNPGRIYAGRTYNDAFSTVGNSSAMCVR